MVNTKGEIPQVNTRENESWTIHCIVSEEQANIVVPVSSHVELNNVCDFGALDSLDFQDFHFAQTLKDAG